MISEEFDSISENYVKPKHYHFFYSYRKSNYYQMISGDPEIIKFLGYDIDKIIGDELDIRQYIHPEDIEMLLMTYDQALVNGGKYDIKYRIQNAKGEYLDIRDIGSRIICKNFYEYCLGGSIRFIPSPEELYMYKVSNIIHQANKHGDLGVFYYRLSDQKLFWSSQLLNIFGIEKQPTIDEYWHFLQEEYKPKSLARFEKMLTQPKRNKSIYKIIRQNDHISRSLFSTTTPIFNDNGSLVAISGTTIDITDLLVILNFESELFSKDLSSQISLNEENVIFIKHNNLHISLTINDIIAISALGDYIQIFVKSKKSPYVIYKTLKEMYEKLPKNQFVQIHRSHIINLNEITQIELNNVQLSSLSFPVSRSYWSLLKSRLDL